LGKRVILYCGSLSLKSGHAIDLLLQAFALIRKKISNAVLLIVGGGEDIDFLKNQIDQAVCETVIFTGKVSPSEVPYYFQLADVSVDPVKDTLANKGRCPLKIFESMQMGVPVVTSDIGDRKMLIEGGKAGVLCKPGDFEDLADTITELLLDENRMKKISRECHRIIKRYQWHIMIDQLLEDIPLLRNKL